MKVRGLDGRQYTLGTGNYARVASQSDSKSTYHLRARAVLKRIYPCDSVVEEIFLPGCPSTLYADFYLPLRALMVEVQGEQHYKQVECFQPTMMDHLKAKGRDVTKRQWCVLNNICLVELPYNETDNEWTQRIIHAHDGR